MCCMSWMLRVPVLAQTVDDRATCHTNQGDLWSWCHRRIAAYDSSCTSASWAGCMGGLIFLSSQVKPCGDGGLVGQQPSAPDPYLHQKRIECQTYILLSCQQLWNLSSKISRTLQLHLTVGVKMMDSGNLLTGVIQSVGLLGLAKTRHGLVMNYQVKPYQINIVQTKHSQTHVSFCGIRFIVFICFSTGHGWEDLWIFYARGLAAW